MSTDAFLPEPVLVGLSAIEDHIRELPDRAEEDEAVFLKQYREFVTALPNCSKRHHLKYPIGG